MIMRKVWHVVFIGLGIDRRKYTLSAKEFFIFFIDMDRIMKIFFSSLIITIFFISLNCYAKNCDSFDSASQVDVYARSNDINAICEKGGYTVLHRNIGSSLYVNGRYVTDEVISELLKLGANPNLADENGFTPLMLALNQAHKLNLVEMLLNNGANINAADKSGETALMQTSDLTLIDLLISKRANLNRKNKDGKTAIMLAAEYKDIKVLEKLFSYGASLTAIDNKGNSIIIEAIKASQNSYLVEWLIEHGAPLNKPNHAGVTPLMVAAYKGDLVLVKLLLENGAKTTLKAKNGATAESFAKASGNSNIASFISNYVKKSANDRAFNEMT
jgi:ankyrin repeat protein